MIFFAKSIIGRNARGLEGTVGERKPSTKFPKPGQQSSQNLEENLPGTLSEKVM